MGGISGDARFDSFVALYHSNNGDARALLGESCSLWLLATPWAQPEATIAAILVDAHPAGICPPPAVRPECCASPEHSALLAGFRLSLGARPWLGFRRSEH